MMLWLFGFLALSVAQAQEVPAPYTRAVSLLRDLYLYPDRIGPEQLLSSAADGIERGVDWLFTDIDGSEVVLRHGNGRELGRVSVTDWNDLPAALYGLEESVRIAGYPWGDVDLRLTVLAGITTDLDPYTRMLAGDSLERFDTRLKGSLVGVGATMRRQADQIVVTDVLPLGPAARGGLKVGDVILRIDGLRTTNLPLSEAVRRVRGAVGTQVALLLDRGGAQVDLRITRENIILDNVVQSVLEDGIGLVRITNISQQTAHNLAEALDDLAARGALADGLVLDLRGNSGGSMKESAATVDRFVRAGLLLTTAGPDGRPVADLTSRMEAREQGNEVDVPMIVLVDHRTASGAEIISGSLAELGRAALVGERTFGKGLVQKIYPLDPHLSFKVTVAEYRLANGRPVADVGIQPDVHVGHVSISANDTRFDGWDVEREQIAWEDFIPSVVVSPLPEGTRPVDQTLELARRALTATAGPARQQVVESLLAEAEQLRAEQEARLIEVLALEGIDWTPSPGDGAAPEVSVHFDLAPEPLPHPKEGSRGAPVVATPLDPAGPARPQDTRIVTVTVENVGPTPVHQALVRLDCATFSPWDGLVVPIGLVPSGETRSGSVRVTLPAGLLERQDRVRVEMRADRRPVVDLPDQLLVAVSTPDPALRVVGHLEPLEQGWQAVLSVTNLGDREITGLEAWFEAPSDPAIELLDAAWREPTLAGGATATFRLGLARAEGGPDLLPMELVLEVDGHGTVFRPDLPLHVSGSEVVRQAPAVLAGRHALSAPIGRYSLPIEISDDSMIDHLVMFVNDDKLLWEAGGASRMKVRPVFELQPGVNTVTVVAVDDEGTRSQIVYRVLGLGGEDEDGEVQHDEDRAVRGRKGQEG